MTAGFVDDQPAAASDGAEGAGDQPTEGMTVALGGLTDLLGSLQIKGGFPVGEGFADFGSDEGALPIAGDFALGRGDDGAGFVVEEGEDELWCGRFFCGVRSAVFRIGKYFSPKVLEIFDFD